MSTNFLGENKHGKGRVRLLKVHRHGDRHDFVQLTAQILLEGGCEDAFTAADNKNIVATDTCKNTVYVLAKKHSFASIEEFGMIIGRHFLTQYDFITGVNVLLTKDLWSRAITPDSKGKMAYHNHGFNKVGPQTSYTKIYAQRQGSYGGVKFQVASGVKSVQILKTTQTGFENFHRDSYRTLPDASDRILATSMDAEWRFTPEAIANQATDYEALNAQIQTKLVNEFFGPADKGVFSASVQATLFDMGNAVLNMTPAVIDVRLIMPNIHNIPFDFGKFDKKLQLENRDHTGNPDIFFPTDEPHGMIEAVVQRTKPKL